MIARGPSLRGIETAGLAVGALFAAAIVPSVAAEFSQRRDIATPAASTPSELCEPARWTGKAALSVTRVAEPAAPVTKVADQLDTGWWVVLAAAPADQDVRDIVQQMEACGLQPFSDFSSKFDGFKAGLNVVVDGAYASKSEAERVRSAALACVPDAYVKQARYLGE